MLNNNKDGLLIFDRFQIDYKLPKWVARIKKDRESHGFDMQMDMPLSIPMRRRSSNGLAIGGTSFISIPSGVTSFYGGTIKDSGINGEADKKVSWFDRIFGRNRLKNIKLEEQKAAEQSNFTTMPMDSDTYRRIQEEIKSKEIPELTVEEFFSSIKNSKEELELLTERFKSYEAGIEHLKNTGQEALYETMCADLEVHRSESQLYATGHRKLVTEQNIIEFAKKAPRELQLDWVKNYTRSIPKKVVDVKVKLDELEIFDNYLVLHYNPDGKGTELTEKEKKAKEDPILFGVILGSHKLYFIGDWIDEYCDLTFDKMIETLGKDAISANDLTANVEMPSEK